MSRGLYADAEKEMLALIRRRGHWELLVRPTTFTERVPKRRELFDIVEKSAVDLGGWRFPFVKDQFREFVNGQRHVDTDWVGQIHRWEHHLEVWRFYTSGQFALFTSVPWDWRDESRWWPKTGRENWQVNSKIGFGHIVQMLNQMFLFAARLVQTAAGDDAVHMEIALAPTKDRALFSDFPRRMLSEDYKADVDRISLRRDLRRVDLLARLDNLIAEASLEVFEEFGFKPQPAILRDVIVEVKGN